MIDRNLLRAQLLIEAADILNENYNWTDKDKIAFEKFKKSHPDYNEKDLKDTFQSYIEIREADKKAAEYAKKRSMNSIDPHERSYHKAGYNRFRYAISQNPANYK